MALSTFFRSPRQQQAQQQCPEMDLESRIQVQHNIESRINSSMQYKSFTLKNQLRATILNSWINILLIAAPVGIAINYTEVNRITVFVINFIAIIPLAAMLSFATEEISLHLGEALGGLLNASFGNAVELIVAVIALAKGEVLIVQTSLIGSVLSNLLLVLGMCFFFGGVKRTEQRFDRTVAQTAASMLILALGGIIIPTAFDQWSTTTAAPIAAISRGTSIILLTAYTAYLFFQLKTQKTISNEESKKVGKRSSNHNTPITKLIMNINDIAAGFNKNQRGSSQNTNEDTRENKLQEPQLHLLVAWSILAGSTAIIGLCAEFMVGSVSALTKTGNISEELVGLILLPIVGNAAEHATAVTVAYKDKMDLAIGVAIGSSIQVGLLLLPLMTIIGWIMSNEAMNLTFDGFQVAALSVAVLLVNFSICDGKSNWIKGLLLNCLYIIIAVCAWYYPTISDIV